MCWDLNLIGQLQHLNLSSNVLIYCCFKSLSLTRCIMTFFLIMQPVKIFNGFRGLNLTYLLRIFDSLLVVTIFGFLLIIIIFGFLLISIIFGFLLISIIFGFLLIIIIVIASRYSLVLSQSYQLYSGRCLRVGFTKDNDTVQMFNSLELVIL